MVVIRGAAIMAGSSFTSLAAMGRTLPTVFARITVANRLSTTVRQVTGRNVLDIIAHVVIVDVKAKLKSTNMTIQEIAYSLNFPSASFFGKYFKRHMGMSPLEYRNS